VIENIRSAQYLGWGIAFAYDTTGQDWTIARNTFQNIERVGVLVDGQGNRATIDSNLFLGDGDGDWVGYGVEVGDGAVAVLTGNTITGYRGVASSDGSISGGVLVTSYFGPNPAADLTLNVLTGNSYGILVGYWATDTSLVTAHYNSIAGNTQGGVDSTGPVVDATLNWWGDVDGPSGVGAGSGDAVSTYVIFSPWLGQNPDGNAGLAGVQMISPMLIIVDDVGPAPSGGYLNAAIGGANALTGQDTIEVRHGTYTYGTAEPITEGVTLVSETGSALHTTIEGPLTIASEGTVVGLPLKGFTLKGNIEVRRPNPTTTVDASMIHINWNDIYETVTNNADGTLDAEFNYWGTQELVVIEARTVGSIDFDPYLPKNADDSYTDVVALLSSGIAADQYVAVARLWDAMLYYGGDVGAYIANLLHDAQPDGPLGNPAANLQTLITLGTAGGGGGGGGGELGGGAQTVFAVGEAISGSFALTDPITGLPIYDAIVSVSLIGTGPDGTPLFAGWAQAVYDEATGEYTFEIATDGLAPGTYQLIFQTNAGQMVTMEVEVV